MRLFTKDIDKKLFAQFEQGSDLENQMVVAKIFNPYGRGQWYIINSDENDPDYMWAIVDLFEVEAGSVSRSELESIKVPPFRLPLERDMYFTPINAAELYRGLLAGKRYAEGGEISIEAQNKDMLLNYAEELEHHVKEFEEAAKKAEKVMPWVIAKIERSSTDLSDVTHYLASENEKRREYGNGEGEEEYADGGEVKWQDAQLGDSALVVSENKMGLIIKPYGRKFHLRFPDGSEKTYDASELKFFGDMDDFDRGGEIKEFNVMYFRKVKVRDGSLMDVMRERYVMSGSLESVLNKAFNNFTMSDTYATIVDKAKGAAVATVYEDGRAVVNKDGYGISAGEVKLQKEEEEVEDKSTRKKLFGFFEDGGEVEEGVDLFEDYDDIPSNVQEVLDNYSDAFEDGNYKELEKANKELGKIGYTFEYGLDGQAYDLRKIGEKGKSEYMAKGDDLHKDSIYLINVTTERVSKRSRGAAYNDKGSGANVVRYTLQEVTGDIKDLEKNKTILKITNQRLRSLNERGGKLGLNAVGALNFFKKYGYDFKIDHKLLKGNENMDLKKVSNNLYLEKNKRGTNLSEYYGDEPAFVDSEVKKRFEENKQKEMAMGGKVKFADKVKSIKKSLLERKNVSPKVQKDYGKTYSPKEAEESAKRIVGAMTAKERLMAKRKKSKK